MKPYSEYFENSKKTYKFRIKIADDVSNEMMEAIEKCLSPFDPVSVGKPKSLPIEENPMNFEGLGPVPVNIVEIELAYPTTVDLIRELVVRETKLPMPNVFVHTEGQDSLQLSRIVLDKDGKPLLTSEYEKSPEDVKELYGDENITITLKNLNKSKFKHQFERPSSEAGRTTNDTPEGVKSPVGSIQNKIPDPMQRRSGRR